MEMINRKRKTRIFASILFSSCFDFLSLQCSLKFSKSANNLYSAHNDLLSFIIIESFKARSGFFVPINLDLYLDWWFPRFFSLFFSENWLRIFDKFSRIFISREEIVCGRDYLWQNKNAKFLNLRESKTESPRVSISTRKCCSSLDRSQIMSASYGRTFYKKKEESVTANNNIYSKI